MRCVMETLEKYAKKDNFYLSDKDLWTSEYTKMMWVNSGETCLIFKFGGQNLNADMSWKTLYKKNLKSRVLIHGEDKDEEEEI